MAFNASIIITAVVSGAARAATELGRAFDTAGKGAVRLVKELNRITNVNNAVRASVNDSRLAISDFNNALNGIAVGAAIREIYRITNLFIGWENQMYAVTGSTEEATKVVQDMIDVSRELGTNLTSAANGFTQLQIAADGSSLSTGQITEIFKSFSGALTLFNADTLKVEGTFRALTQMFSKGVVQAEELRGQLAEHLPGAIQLAARAMGMGTKSLGEAMRKGLVLPEDLIPKLAAQYQKELGAAIEMALKTPRAAYNRLVTEIRMFMIEIGKAFDDEFVSVLELATKQVKELTDLIKSNTDLLKVGIGAITGYAAAWVAVYTSLFIVGKSLQTVVTLLTFGGAGNPFIKTLTVLVSTVGAVSGAMYVGRDAIVAYDKEVDTAGDVFERFIRKLTGFQSEFDKVNEEFSEILKADDFLGEELSQMDLGSMLKGYISVLTDEFEKALPTIKRTANEILDTLKWFVEGASGFGRSIWTGLEDIGAIDAAKWVINKIITLLLGLRIIARSVWTAMGKDAEGFWNALFETIKIKLGQAITGIFTDYDFGEIVTPLQRYFEQNEIDIKLDLDWDKDWLSDFKSTMDQMSEGTLSYLEKINAKAMSVAENAAWIKAQDAVYNALAKELGLEQVSTIKSITASQDTLIKMSSDAADSTEELSDKIAEANHQLKLLKTDGLDGLERKMAIYRADSEYIRQLFEGLKVASTKGDDQTYIMQLIESLQKERQAKIDLAIVTEQVEKAKESLTKTEKELTKESGNYIKILLDMRDALDDILLSGLELDNQLRERTDIYDGVISQAYKYLDSVKITTNATNESRDSVVALVDDLSKLGTIEQVDVGVTANKLPVAQVKELNTVSQELRNELTQLGSIVNYAGQEFFELGQNGLVSLTTFVELANEGKTVAESIEILKKQSGDLSDVTNESTAQLEEMGRIVEQNGRQMFDLGGNMLIPVESARELAETGTVMADSINQVGQSIEKLNEPIVKVNSNLLQLDTSFKRYQSENARIDDLNKLQKTSQDELSKSIAAYVTLRDTYLSQGSMTEAQLEALASAQDQVAKKLKLTNELQQIAIELQRQQIANGTRTTWDIEFTDVQLKNMADGFNTAKVRAIEYKTALADIQELVDTGWMTQHEAEIARLEAAYNKLPDYAKEIGDAFSDAFQSLITGSASAEEAVVSMLKAIANAVYQELVAKQIASIVGNLVSSLFGGGGTPVRDGWASNSYAGFANGGIMTESGPMQLKRYATGGIANSPQMALFGEGSQPEAYVPLPDGRSIPVTVSAKDVSVQEAQKPEVKVVVNNLPGQNAEVSRDASGGLTIDIVRSVLANDVNKGGVPWVGAMERRYGMSRGRA